VDIFSQILAGLGYAHERGVVHRDIKPANIMINCDGAIKLADFGIAKLIGPGTTSSGLIVGTPSYMSPEQVLSRQVDARSDLFSVGCTLYEVLTGEKAYPGETATAVMYRIVHESPVRPASLRPGIDPRLEEVVLRALANDPDDRFPTCRDMVKALEDCLARPAASTPASHLRGDFSPSVRSARTSPFLSKGFNARSVAKRSRRGKALSARSIAGLGASLVIVVLILVAGLARRRAHVKPLGRLPDRTAEVHYSPAVPAPASVSTAHTPAAETGARMRPPQPRRCTRTTASCAGVSSFA
jgi:serine/threonine protein kinase